MFPPLRAGQVPPTIRSGATANGVYRSMVNSVGLLFCDI